MIAAWKGCRETIFYLKRFTANRLKNRKHFFGKTHIRSHIHTQGNPSVEWNFVLVKSVGICRHLYNWANQAIQIPPLRIFGPAANPFHLRHCPTALQHCESRVLRGERSTPQVLLLYSKCVLSHWREVLEKHFCH